jgi:hypothetical protein
MRAFRLVLGSFVLLAASFALAQPPGSAPAAASSDLYPLAKDTKWVYKVGETTITVKVASTKTEGGKTEAVLETMVNEKAVASETIIVQADGIYRSAINKNAITPPVKILEMKDGKPAAKGTKWKIESKIQEQPVKGEFTIKDDKEKLKVPLNDFEAIVVEGPDFDIAGTKTGVKYWFVAGKGIAKLSYSISGNEAVLELKEFAEAKK